MHQNLCSTFIVQILYRLFLRHEVDINAVAYWWDALGDGSIVQFCRAAPSPLLVAAVKLELHEMSKHRCEDHVVMGAICIVSKIVQAIVSCTAANWCISLALVQIGKSGS